MDLHASEQNITLADILHECPRLLQLLTNNCLKSLSATSQGLRQLARGTVISMSSTAFARLSKVDWPRLRMIKLSADSVCPALDPAWTLLAKVNVSTLCGLWLNVLLLKAPTTNQTALETASDWLDAHMCEIMLRQDWPQASTLSVECGQEASLAAAVLRELGQKPWSELYALTVFVNHLDVQGIAAIVQGRWANISSLSITCAQFDDRDMQQLVAGEWPKLLQIRFHGVRCFHTNMSHIATPKWKALQEICLSSMYVQDTVMQQLVTNPLRSLAALELSECCIGAHAMSVFSEADWPVLTRLVLRSSPMDATAMSQLALATLPALSKLDLSKTGLKAKGMEYLVQAEWPRLQDLSLCQNPLNLQAVEHLVKGQWTSLQSLQMMGTQLSAESIKELTKGQWHELSYLCMDCDFVDDSAAKILGFDRHQLLKDLEECRFTGVVEAAMHQAPAGQMLDNTRNQCLRQGVWPKLATIHFWSTLSLHRKFWAAKIGLGHQYLQN